MAVSKQKNAPVLSAKELRVLLDETLLVRHVSVPLAVFDADEAASAVLEQMTQRNFDFAAVQSDGRVFGYVYRNDLNSGQCRDHIRTFAHTDIVSSSTPLVEIVPMLAEERSFLFVLNRTEIDQIVTRSDLQKAPVRMALFGIVTLLEMYMLWMTRICYPQETFEAVLGQRLDKAQMLLAERKSRNEEIDLADCLQMCDKRVLLLKVPGFAEYFAFESKNRATDFFKEAEDLRNDLAHSHQINGKSWGRVAALAAGIEAFSKKVEEGAQEFAELFEGKGMTRPAPEVSLTQAKHQ